MKFDDILKELGEFGPYQKRVYFLLCIPAISAGCFMMGAIISLAVPEHRCKLPGYKNDTFEVQDQHHLELINQTIPPSSVPGQPYDRCHMYMSSENSDTQNTRRWGQRHTEKCNEWVYDRSVFKSTFTSEMNLICDDSLKVSHALMIYYFGVLMGDLGIGLLSDLIGRKKSMYLSIVIQLGSALGVAWSPNYATFVILQFIIGAACHGVFLPSAVLSIELVGPSKRLYTGLTIHMFFAIGLVYLSGISYFLRDWFYIQLAVAVPYSLFLLYWWMVISMNYYGITMHGSTLGTDFYLNFFLMALIEFPSKLLSLALIDRVGRKKLNMFYMIVGGLACLGTIAPVLMRDNENLKPLTTALVVLGKFGPSGAFGVIYVYSMELYPTVVRNYGLGASSAVARIGGMLAPYIAKSGELIGGQFGQAEPMIIFGVAPIVAGLLCLMLPETLNRKLPDTIEDAENFGMNLNRSEEVVKRASKGESEMNTKL